MITNDPRLLRKGWPKSKVREHHLEYATALVAKGVEFHPIRPDTSAPVEKLVNERVHFDSPYRMDSSAGGIRVDLNGCTIGSMVLEGMDFPGEGKLVRVTAVAVAPDWERQGLGTVLLGMISEVVKAKIVYGGCEPGAAKFYQRAGFDVLAPDEPLIIPMGKQAAFRSSNKYYPLWFVRNW